MKKLVSALLVLLSVGLFGQEDSVKTQDKIETGINRIPPAQKTRDWTIGTELDVLPYASGGYYVSLFYGKEQLRYRGVFDHSRVPQFATKEGFTNHEVWAAAFIVDYFFKPNYEGWWVAAGYEYWENQIQDKDELYRLYYNNNVMTYGVGYVWKFAGNFYLNPWAAAHILITGHGPYQMNDLVYKPSVFVPEVSLKIGWHF
jgi:hypothetical protein